MPQQPIAQPQVESPRSPGTRKSAAGWWGDLNGGFRQLSIGSCSEALDGIDEEHEM